MTHGDHPVFDWYSYRRSPRMPIVYWGAIPFMWMSYVVYPQPKVKHDNLDHT